MMTSVFTNRPNSKVTRKAGRWPAPRFSGNAGLAGLLGLVFAVIPGLTSAVSCVAPSRTGETPPSVAAAREEMGAYQPENPGGYERLAAQIRQNRDDFQRGRITALEAEQQGGFAVSGNRTLPVLSVLYSDSPNNPYSPAALEAQLFGPSAGTMYSYYVENSYDQLFVTGDVYGFRRLSGIDFDYTGFSYGLNGGGALMVLEAIGLFDDQVDFRLYDNDGPDGVPNSGDDDGYVDVLTVVHPEMGAECGSIFGNMWSHHSYLSGHLGFSVPTNDNAAGGGKIRINRYLIAPGLSCATGMIEIGVYCHEYGHALGLPDLYDTVDGITGDSDGIGDWGVMGSGSWNSVSSPSHFSAFSKNRLGWLDYFDVLQDGNLCLPPVETNPIAARVWKDGIYGSEFFVVENRQAIGFDAALASAGIVIYHVDMDRYNDNKSTNRVNANETRKAIDVETADAFGPGHTVDRDDLDVAGDGNRGDATDVWCAGAIANAFNSTSRSDSRALNDTQTGVAVSGIGPCTGDTNGWICANYTVGVAQPVDLCIEDCEGGTCGDLATCQDWWASPNIWLDHDENGFQDAPSSGIENKFFFEVLNLGPEVAAGAEVSLYIAPGAMGLEWPDDAVEQIGTTSIPILAKDATATDYFVYVYPDLLDLIGHWCVGAVITHPQDLSTGTSAPLSNNIAQVNSQVFSARAGSPVEPRSGDDDPLAGGDECPGPMVQSSKVYLYDGVNPFQKPRFVSVRVGTPPDFDDAIVPAHWQLSITPHTGPFMVSPTMQDSIVVSVTSDFAGDGEFAHVPLTLWDDDTGEMIGGLTADFSVDCAAPLAPDLVSAHWREFPGDAFGEYNVIVNWGGVTTDVNGNADIVEYYEVQRSDDQGSPWTLIERIIIDDDPSTPLYQWFDLVPTIDCPMSYFYRIRAVDRAGNIGAYSDPIPLDCAITSAPLPESNLADTRATPNPFRNSTEITYRVPSDGIVEVAIFDITGKQIRTLENRRHAAGVYRVRWDGSDDLGRTTPSGIYFYRVRGGGAAGIWKLVRSR